jgi:pullulanase
MSVVHRPQRFRFYPGGAFSDTGEMTPLIAAGQEFATDYWIPEDDHNTGRRTRPRPLRWAERDDQFGSALFGLYRRLLEVRRDHPALRSRNFYPPKWEDWQTQFDEDGFGVDTQQQAVVYHRWGNGSHGGTEYFITD